MAQLFDVAVTKPMLLPTGTRRGWLPFFADLIRVAGTFWTSQHRWLAWALTVGLVTLTLMMVAVQVALNLWTERLYNALSSRSLAEFVALLGVLGAIVLANVVVMTTHLRLKRRLQIAWRRWLTDTISGEWMSEARHYQINYTPGAHSNPDGRIAEDIRIATESALDLGHSLFYCTVLLASFANILWTLSGDFSLTAAEIDIHIPGHLVWAALLYAIVGGTVAVLLGRPLVRAVDGRQTSEASFRFGIARARENSMAIGVLHGEEAERRYFAQLFDDVATAWNRQTTALANIFVFTSSWSVLLQVVPVLISAPRFIVGAITLGVLMQIAQAFQQTVGALSWPVDNVSQVAEWRASAERVLGLHGAIHNLVESVKRGGPATIGLRRGDRAALTFRNVAIAEPDGTVAIGPFDLDIGPGERVLISGDAVAAIKLFKATAGLWPWGRGEIELPNAPIYFLPQQSYVPPGTLRDVICYPDTLSPCDDAAVADILIRVGLTDLASRLDHVERWDHLLAADELQRLGFARLLVHRPSWAFLQDAMDALGPAAEAEMLRIVDAELPDMSVISIANHDARPDYYRRALTLVKHDGFSVIEERPRVISLG